MILRLYELEGGECVRKFNGQWAFAIWDTRTRTLFLSRDRLGIRPLFYTECGGEFLFASEIKALFAHPQVSRALDAIALDNIFTFWTTLAPRTPFAAVRALMPGHSLTWRHGGTSITQDWQPSYPVAGAPTRTAESVDRLRGLLDDAVRVRLRSDVPVAAYLSGGLDSSLIVALMKHADCGPVRTFSIAFGDTDFDESARQRTVADVLGTEHSELRCSADDVGRVFPDVVWHAETPLLRTAPAPLFLLARAVRDHGYKVVLTGEGADEAFGGYDIFKEAKIRRFWSRQPMSPRRPSLLARPYPYMPDLQRLPAAQLQGFFNVAPTDLASPCFSHLPRWRLTSRLKMFLSDEIRASIGAYDGRAELEASLPYGHQGWDPFCQGQYLETAHLLPGYLLSSQGDRVAMAHGVEARYPYLDPEVMAYASALPPTLKMKGLNEKYLLRQLGRELLPSSIWQRTKQPYRAPDGRAFFGSQRPPAYVDDLLSSTQVRRDGIVKPDAVSRLVSKFRDGKAIGVKDGMALVGILSTQILVDRFINHFDRVAHGDPYQPEPAEIHRR